MKRIQALYDPPQVIKRLFSGFIWNTVNDKPLLTFDDGPIPETTPLILKKLGDYRLKAIFFTVGDNVKKYPGLCKEILSEGHVIGSHMIYHRPVTKVKFNEALKEIELFNNIMQDEFGYYVKYFRPPHGKFNFSTPSLMKRSGLKCVMWSLLTYDYKNDMNVIKFAIQNFLKSNSIIVFHDSLKSKNVIADSIDAALETASMKNYTFGEPTECLK